MKEKRTYSLTAKERKAKRMAEQNKENNKQKAADKASAQQQAQEAPSREQAESAMLSAQKNSKRSALAVGAVACLAIVLIVVALIAPVIMYVVNPYRGMDSVIARFNLSNGMVLEYEIDEKSYDIAATNFIFLAKNGYFDNTVFYDAQNGWLRFGGYEAQPETGSGSSSDYNSTHHHAQNEAFCTAFSALPTESFKKVTGKFGYRLHKDEGGDSKTLLEQEGILAYRYYDTATEFQLTYREQAVDSVESLSGSNVYTETLSSTMVGRALNDQTLENIRAIAATAKLNEKISQGYLWRPPTPDIKITSVKVYNLDSSKWDNFNFLSYVKEGNRLSRWLEVI